MPVSHAGVLQHHGRANGRQALIGGIGGVVTVPAAQRRGYAGQLLRHAAAFLRDEWKVDFALLFCIDQRVRFYQRLEWAEVPGEVLIDQRHGKVPCPFHVMTLAFKPEFSRIEALDLELVVRFLVLCFAAGRKGVYSASSDLSNPGNS